MPETCTQCGDPIDLEAWPIITVVDGESALFCRVACHDRWRDGHVDRLTASPQ